VSRSFGKLIAVHTIDAAHVQRAAFIAVLSFIFFAGMMFLFYIRESLLYFLLASAFLIVYLVTMLSWLIQRKNVVQVFEGGFAYRSQQAAWDEIAEVRDDGSVVLKAGKQIVISPAIDRLPALLDLIRRRSGHNKIEL
jgi:hypothetical protein